ncbi:uncharacterized protein L203_103704 [Cryptococcus depauperatus CBS 7841]|uniref:Cytoplasmic protein n=1 Tax=Cryptococcus depauperatus CBS 7841 TaxID=1295531 RepID=A0AAJ8JU57_9TREE
MTAILHPPLPLTATHKDYARFHFDTTNVPDKRIVGLLACQRDPLLRTLRTKVHAAREASVAAPPAPKGKHNQKKKTATSDAPTLVNGKGTQEKGVLWEIELLDTVIFPEGGGQSSDTGVIHLLDSNGGIQHSFPVEMCFRRKLNSVHYARIPPGIKVDGGWEGRDVEVEVDWDRRIDQMAIHTSQHLLSAIIDKTLSLPTLSWSMHSYPSLEPPYVELARALTIEEAINIERLCQDAIKDGKKIWIDFSLQGGEIGGEGDAREFRTLPKDYDGGVIRHINIKDIDRNACCGTQTPNLSYLSLFHIIPPTPSMSAKPTPTKLYFQSGPRAILALTEASRTLSAAAKLMGFGRADLIERLEKSEQIKKETTDSFKGLRYELANLITDQAVRQGKENKGVAWIMREEKGTHDFEWLGIVAATYQDTMLSLWDKEQPSAPLIILTSNLPSLTPPTQTLLLVMSTDNSLTQMVSDKLKKRLEGRVKGGGAKGRFMSKIDGKWGKIEKDMLQGIVEELKNERT